jgi:hypothetical protein
MIKKTEKMQNHRLTINEKKEIIIYTEQNPLSHFTRIAEIFSFKFKKAISGKSVSNYVKGKEKIFSMSLNNNGFKRINTNHKYSNINDNLIEWLKMVESCGGTYTELIIKEKLWK